MHRRINLGLLVLGSLPLLAACGDAQRNAPISSVPGAVAGTPAAGSVGSAAGAGAGAGTAGTPITSTGAAGAARAGNSAAGASGAAAGAPSAGTGEAGSPAAGASGAAAGASGSAAGAGGGSEEMAGAGGAAAPAWMTRDDLGKGDGSDVITIGDSWMDYVLGGGGIQAGLDRAGTRYRHYALSGTTLLSGQIPGQYATAKRANPKILTAIMTGGGNDIMFSNSCSTAESCEMAVKQLVMAWDKLWTEMATDGVKDVVLIQYSADAGTAPTNTRPKMVDQAPICLSGKLNCHYLATTDLVMGNLVDGIHPTSAANDRIAKALLMLMEQRKMRR